MIMQMTIDLSDKEVAFLQWMVEHEKKFEKISTMEQAIRECINMAMFEETETSAMQEGM